MVNQNEVVVGIDVAKDFSYFCMIDPTGKKIGKAFKVYHQLENLTLTSNKLKEVEHQYNCPVVLVMESTGHYSKIPFHFFSQENFVVHMVNPIQSHSIKNISVRKVKNDKVDAERIALLYRLGEVKTSNSTTHHDDLKVLVRQYLSLSDEITKFSNQITSLLEQMLPGYEKVFSDIISPSSLYILNHFSSSDKILHADKEELISKLSRTARRSKSWATEKYEKLLQVAKASLKLGSTPITVQAVLLSNLTIIQTMKEQQAFIYKEIIRLSKQKQEVSLIRSIPSLGPLSAAIILSELRDPSAFSNPRKMIAFCGIDPSVHESGKFKGTKMKISKRGSGYLRRALYMAALSSIKKKANGEYPIPTLADYYFEKIKYKPKKAALVAVMHKLVNYIYAVLRDQQPFVEYSREQHMTKYHQLNSSRKAS